ncbi:hypothetical protein PC1C4_06020 [Paraprevotella clara]|uniref:hypothetical protein n=1 Tax=Paraprevotella clara TaxID=454154 RepID=UPI002490EA47|nr:hypothetical protein [Paraprevotella clara]BDI73880.1 hypothetical protein PC1C4_06020 [Paraprevotella clara]
MKREYDVKREMLLVFRNIVVFLFKGKDVFVSGGSFLAREYLLFLERVRKVYPGLTKDDVFIMLLVRMSFKNTEIARLLHVKPASFRLRRWRLKKKLGDSGMDLRSMIMKL